MRYLLAAIAALLIAPAAASAATIPVPPGNDAQYDAAYKAAAAGDVLELTTGQYGTWTVPAGTKQITVKAAVGARPVFKQIANYGNCAPNDGSPGADNITFDGLRIDAGGQRPPVQFCALFENGEHTNVTFKNGYIGNTVDQKGAVLGGRNAVIDNTRFGDVKPVGSEVHNECIWASSEGQKITNNYFEGVCGNTGPLVMTGGSGVQTMEFSGNTFEPQLFNHGAIIFGSACGGIGSNCSKLTVRNNTFLPGTNPYNNPTDHTFNGSREGCNTPSNAFASLPGITHEGCGTPTPTPTPTPTSTPTPTATPTATPSPTATPTATPTPSPTPTPTPVPTPPPYQPECAKTCDEQIAHLQADVAAHEATIAQLQARTSELEQRISDLERQLADMVSARDAWKAKAESADTWRDRWKKRALEAEAQPAQDKLDRIAAILAE